MDSEFGFSQKSLTQLSTCDTRLQEIAYKALSYGEHDFSIIQGYRDLEDQMAAYEAGKSRIDGVHNKSNHNYMPSRAFDFLPYPFKGWDVAADFHTIANLLLRAADELGTGVRWGGNFTTIKDLDHLELYP